MKKIQSAIAILSCAVFVGSNAASQNVTPKENTNGTFYFDVASMYFEIDPNFGSRISSLKHNGEELLYVNKNYGDGYLWGATLWQSPQSEWGWPPSLALDQDAYSGGIIGNSVSLLSNEDYNFNTHLTFRKTFSGNNTDTSISITYTLINTGTTAHAYSAWELTRVNSGGMAFFPYGDGAITGNFADKVQKQNEIAWYQYKGDEESGKKYYSDGAQGWDGWVNDNDILLLRTFKDVPSDKQAPEEKEIELWFNGHDSYIELEIQSEYSQIEPGDSLVWNVKWFLRKLPSGVINEMGSTSLINYVNGVLNRSTVDVLDGNILADNLFNVYPNPSSGKIIFQSLEHDPQPADITLYNLQGQLLLRSNIEIAQHSIDLSQLPSGFYYYKINRAQSIIQTGTVLLSK